MSARRTSVKRAASSVTTVFEVYRKCVEAVEQGKLIRRESSSDKEFHFQNWVGDRLRETGEPFEVGGRNSYPDFRIVRIAEGFEIKGLAYPGRETNYDCNSQVPSGLHNGRVIFHVFGRYPQKPDGNRYPVLDLVICHGDFLNADHSYVHKNKHLKGFGSYGDIMIRDRKMYVAPTPFALASGVAHARTLILPERIPATSKDFIQAGRLIRIEADHLLVGYSFNLRDNTIKPNIVPNPSAGKEHIFFAWRLRNEPGGEVTMGRSDAGDLGDEGCDDEEE